MGVKHELKRANNLLEGARKATMVVYFQKGFECMHVSRGPLDPA